MLFALDSLEEEHVMEVSPHRGPILVAILGEEFVPVLGKGLLDVPRFAPRQRHLRCHPEGFGAIPDAFRGER